MFRKMRRFKQQLSNRECERILTDGKRGVLAVLGDEEYPYAVPLNFVYDGESVYFHCAVEGHKLDAVKAHPKASFCVMMEQSMADDGWSYFVDSVIVFGRVSIVEDEAERLDKLQKLGLKYFPTAEMVDRDIKKNAARALVLKLEVEHMSGKHVHEN